MDNQDKLTGKKKQTTTAILFTEKSQEAQSILKAPSVPLSQNSYVLTHEILVWCGMAMTKAKAKAHPYLLMPVENSKNPKGLASSSTQIV